MDELMEDSFNDDGSQSLEIDLDYEFDAARYFDFSCAESLAEAQAAELWFEMADSYPPSPYIAKLFMREDLVEDLDTITKSEAAEHANSFTSHSDPDISDIDENSRDCKEVKDRSFFNGLESSQNSQQAFPSSVMNCFLDDSADVISHAGNGLTKGWKCSSHMNQDIPKVKTMPNVKAPFSRVSTLMRPTASQLAKQTQPRDIKDSSRTEQRFLKPWEHKSDRSLESLFVNESQAAKRQKLEGGHLHKVLDTKQQTNLIHKVSKKDGLFDSDRSRLRLTIPREPELVTSRRAQRIRPKQSTEVGEHVLPTVPSFKARPLNRKILMAPSMPLPQKSTPRLPEFQEFNLKTSHRAIQHLSAAPSLVSHNHRTGGSTAQIGIGTKDSKRFYHRWFPPSQSQKPVVDELKCKRNEDLQKFKARPLNKKILSSKGDMGVFRSNKRATTVTMEFNFQTDKRIQQNLPIELFEKLSLNSELQQQNTTTEAMLSRPPSTLLKCSKENIDSLQQEHKISYVNMEKMQRLRAKQIQHASDGGIPEIRSQSNMCRNSNNT